MKYSRVDRVYTLEHWPASYMIRTLRPANSRQTQLTCLNPADATVRLFVSLLTVSRSFHPLFKVLFIFPSRYLFTIGLVTIFSFQWSLPPTLGCNPKQPDSSTVTDCRRITQAQTRYTGLSPSLAHYSKWTLPERIQHKETILDYNSLTTSRSQRLSA